MKTNFICGLDVGTFKICATCGRLDPTGRVDVLASQTVPAQGIASGRVIDSKKVAACIREAIGGLRKACGMKVRRVYANIDSPDLRAKICQQQVSFAQKTQIRESHIENLIFSAIASNISLDRRVVHIGFRNFALDAQDLASVDPQGRKADKLSLKIILVSARILTITSFLKSISEAGLILQDMVPSGYAQAQALAMDSGPDKQNNNILIDIGAGLSKITLFKQGLVKDIVFLPCGAEDISEEIAARLNLSVDCAEGLKIKYGRAFSDQELVDQKIIAQDRLDKRIIQLRQLREIIISKITQLLDQVRKALLELETEDLKPCEIIFTGGGSILEGFLERAEQVLARPVKMGFLHTVKDNQMQAQSALYATSIGLIRYGFKQGKDNKGLYKPDSWGSFLRIARRAEQLYQEYF